MGPYHPQQLELRPSDLNAKVWVHSLLMKPGWSELFVIYRIDEDRVFRGLIRQKVQMRSIQTHSYKIAAPKKIVMKQMELPNIVKGFKMSGIEFHFE